MARAWLRGGALGAIALAAVLALGRTGRAADQRPYQGSTPLSLDGPAAPAPLPSSAAEIADALKAAAAIGAQQQEAAALRAAETEAAAAGLAPPATPATGRSNPFQASGRATRGAAGDDLLLPADRVDAEKVVVQDNREGFVSLMVRDGSLRQVVSMIAKTQRLNLVFAGPTDTQVTASFERQPWQTVLDALLSASGHTWSSQGGVIYIASVDAADFLPPAAEGRRVEVYELDFAAAQDIDQTIQGLLSPAGNSWVVQTNSADNRRTREAVAVLDYPSHHQRIAEYVSLADQPPRQVYIQAHILQVELTDECRNGINFKNLAGWSSADMTLSTNGFANQNASPSFLVNLDGTGLDGLIELLQTTNDVKTLASPEIHAVSGQESHIQIGERLGYRVTTTTQTSSLESVQMLDVGVVLRVTPRVTRDGRVLMRILPKVSTGVVDPETGLPSERTTEVETDVMLCSGQGMLIGGLIQETDSNIQSKIPFLGDVPYAGVLFQKRNIVRSRKEIVVTLQPHVLPFAPHVADAHAAQYQRTVEPLTHGAIHEYPRLYEPRMPDPLQPKYKKAAKHPRHFYAAQGRYGDADPPPSLPYPPHRGEPEYVAPEDAEPEYLGPQYVEPETIPAPQAGATEYRGVVNVSFNR